jgi:UDP-N-acetylglucosamine--N-acetylmuramyl-(pentapeptide) pyrophosphoryl-undecaprenol N-acetylglucosamine transferase
VSPVRHLFYGLDFKVSNGMRILAVAGSSGGHIFPAVALLENFKSKFPDAEALLLVPRNNAARGLDAAVFKVSYISVTGIKPGFSFQNIITLYNFFKGSLETLFIMLEFRPDTVIGFGSLACLPAVLLAWLFRIKIIIHEQNVMPGAANKLLGIFADRIAVSFAQSKEYFIRYKNKVIVTGNLLRRGLIRIESKEARVFLGLNPDKFTILAIGGSQGSSSINAGFLGAVSALSGKLDFQVIHISGEKDFVSLKGAYGNLKIESRIFAFFEAMQYVYSASDLVVSRAGATGITELIFFKLPAIISPYPYAGEHQAANAAILKNAGAAYIVRDQDLNKEQLAQIISGLINDRARLDKMRFAYRDILLPQAEDLLLQEVMSLY